MYQGDVPLIEEINEQGADDMFGGTILTSTEIPLITGVASQPLGNKGFVCTLTKECQPSCN